MENTFALIAERARIAEQYIKEEISIETFYAEMDRIDKQIRVAALIDSNMSGRD